VTRYADHAWSFPEPKEVGGEGDEKRYEVDAGIAAPALLMDLRDRMDALAVQLQANANAAGELLNVVITQMQITNALLCELRRRPWWRIW
jgi:hypothetical protein